MNDTNTHDRAVSDPESSIASHSARSFHGPSALAAYWLLATTIGAASVAFWQVFARGGADLMHPLATVMVSGLAGSLMCVLTRESAYINQRPIVALYRWLQTAAAGSFTSVAVFGLASIAFGSIAGTAFNYPGLGLLGAITGYLGASIRIDKVMGLEVTPRSPLARVGRDMDLRLPALVDSLTPRVSSAIQEALLGPPTPLYEGYVTVDRGQHPPMAQPGHLRRFDLTIWFDTSPGPTGLVAPVTIGERHIQAGKVDPSATIAAIRVDLLLHVPVSRESPLRRTVSVPLTGPSEKVTFAVQYSRGADAEPSTTLQAAPAARDGVIPPDTYLEIRCRGALVRTIDIRQLNGSLM